MLKQMHIKNADLHIRIYEISTKLLFVLALI